MNGGGGEFGEGLDLNEKGLDFFLLFYFILLDVFFFAKYPNHTLKQSLTKIILKYYYLERMAHSNA